MRLMACKAGCIVTFYKLFTCLVIQLSIRLLALNIERDYLDCKKCTVVDVSFVTHEHLHLIANYLGLLLVSVISLGVRQAR